MNINQFESQFDIPRDENKKIEVKKIKKELSKGSTNRKLNRMPLTHCRAADIEFSTSITCTQTMPESSLQILCKCKVSSQSNEYNGTTNIQCNGTNCINRINGGACESEQINGVESEALTETRYITTNIQQSTIVFMSMILIIHLFLFYNAF